MRSKLILSAPIIMEKTQEQPSRLLMKFLDMTINIRRIYSDY